MKHSFGRPSFESAINFEAGLTSATVDLRSDITDVAEFAAGRDEDKTTCVNLFFGCPTSTTSAPTLSKGAHAHCNLSPMSERVRPFSVALSPGI